jgi:hypothetical protein
VSFNRKSSATLKLSSRKHSKTIVEGEKIIINDGSMDLFEQVDVKRVEVDTEVEG